MSEQSPEDVPLAPAPGAAPVPDFPHLTAPAAREEPAREDPSSRAAALEAELARIRADAVKGAKVLLRVLPPHSEFHHAGLVVTREPVPVPAHAAGPLTEAAGQAGVTIEEA